MNENKANYAKIGFFVLTGFGLILTVIGVAGARVFNQQVVPAETYFTESVTGLDVGSPVKYRGVPVGAVRRIGFVASEYGTRASAGIPLEQANQILVELALDPERFSPLRDHDPAAFIAQLVADGVRVKLAASGVTGLSYLELDYYPAATNGPPSAPPAWTPRHPYIPSTPSTMAALKMAMDDVFVNLSRINIQALGDELLAMLYLLQGKLVDVDLAALSSGAAALLAELRATNRSAHELLAAPELRAVPADLAAAAGSARRLGATLETQLEPLALSLRDLSGRAAALADTLTAAATNTGERVEQTVAALGQTAHTLNRAAASQQHALAELVQNLRRASAGLDELLAELRDNPSALLFAPPPEPLPEREATPR